MLLQLRDQRLLNSYQAGKNDILSELVFPSPDGSILDPDNLYHRYFQPVLSSAGLRKIRLHDLRHTFGSLLIQAGASLAIGPAGGRGKAQKELVSGKPFLHPETERQVTEVSRSCSGVCHKTPITSVVPSSVRRAMVNSWPTN